MIAAIARTAFAVLVFSSVGLSPVSAEDATKPCRLLIEAEYEGLNREAAGVEETFTRLLEAAGYHTTDEEGPTLTVRLDGKLKSSKLIDYEDTGEIHLAVDVGLTGSLTWQRPGADPATHKLTGTGSTHAETSDEQELLSAAYGSAVMDTGLPRIFAKLAWADEAGRLAFYRRMLRSDHPAMVHSTVIGLGELEDPSPALPELLKAFRQSEWVADAIAALMIRIGGKEVVDAFLVAAADGFGDRREAAVKALVNFPEKRVIDALVEAKMAETSSYVLEHAIKDIGEAAVPRVLEELATPEHQETAADLLRLLGSKTAVEPLLALLSSEERMVRWQAARALGEIGDDRAVEPVLKLAREDAEVRRIALLALSELKAWKAVPVMLDGLEDEDVWAREFAARALAKISGEDHGDDAAAWRKWWESEKDKHPEDSATN